LPLKLLKPLVSLVGKMIHELFMELSMERIPDDTEKVPVGKEYWFPMSVRLFN
jgi:hypothetical protein